MKAKEFLSKIMHGDKTTIRKNTGLIGFDEKGNSIEVTGTTGLYAVQMIAGQSAFAILSPTQWSSVTITFDGQELQAEDYVLADPPLIVPEEHASEINVRFDITNNVTGWYFANGKISDELSTLGSHTVTVTCDGQSVTFTITIENFQ